MPALPTNRTTADDPTTHVADHNALHAGFNAGFFGFKNAVINGSFDIWQRGAGPFGNSVYHADQWSSYVVGSTISITQQTFALGTTIGPFQPKFFHRTAVTSVAAAGNVSLLVNRIEGVRTFAGRQVTFSFWAKADATKDVALELAQNFGGGGTPSADVSVALGRVTLTTAWQRFSATVTMPSIAGKTLGTNGADHVQVTIFYDAGSAFNARTASLGQQSGTFDIWGVQVEPGDKATDYEYRPPAVELPLCMRYFQRMSGDQQGVVNLNYWSTTLAYGVLHLPVPMRVAPASSASSAAALTVFAASVSNASTALGFTSTPTAVEVTATTTARTLGFGAWARLATGAYLDFSAEL